MTKSIVDFFRENPRQTRNYNELITIYLKLHKTVNIAHNILIFLWSFDSRPLVVCRFPDSVDAVFGKGLGLSDLMHSAQLRSVLLVKGFSLVDVSVSGCTCRQIISIYMREQIGVLG